MIFYPYKNPMKILRYKMGLGVSGKVAMLTTYSD